MLQRHFKKLVWNTDNDLPKPLSIMSYHKLRVNDKCKVGVQFIVVTCKDTDTCKSYLCNMKYERLVSKYPHRALSVCPCLVLKICFHRAIMSQCAVVNDIQVCDCISVKYWCFLIFFIFYKRPFVLALFIFDFPSQNLE